MEWKIKYDGSKIIYSEVQLWKDLWRDLKLKSNFMYNSKIILYLLIKKILEKANNNYSLELKIRSELYGMDSIERIYCSKVEGSTKLNLSLYLWLNFGYLPTISFYLFITIKNQILIKIKTTWS